MLRSRACTSALLVQVTVYLTHRRIACMSVQPVLSGRAAREVFNNEWEWVVYHLCITTVTFSLFHVAGSNLCLCVRFRLVPRQALREDPDNVKALYRRAVVYRLRDQFK